MKVLYTERLTLRPIQHADLSYIKSLLADASIMKYVLLETAYNDEQADKLIKANFATAEDDSIGLSVLQHNVTNEVIGFAGLLPCPYLGFEDVEFGYIIGSDYQGCGYATEIALELVRYVLVELKKARILALVNPLNVDSRKILEKKLGMRYLQDIPERGIRCVYELTKETHRKGCFL